MSEIEYEILKDYNKKIEFYIDLIITQLKMIEDLKAKNKKLENKIKLLEIFEEIEAKYKLGEKINVWKICLFQKANSKEEWHELRKLGIGGSEASIILNENPYKTKLELFEEKLNQSKGKDLSNNEAVQKAQLEPLIRQIFAIENKDNYEVLEDDNTYFSKKYPFMLANIDGLLIDKKTNEILGLEIKLQELEKLGKIYLFTITHKYNTIWQY